MLKDELTLVARIVIDAIQSQMASDNVSATNEAADSLGFEVTEKGIRFFGADHLKYIEDGRRAGSFPNVDRLSDWVSVRNIQYEIDGRMLTHEQVVYLIGRSIQRLGIVPKNTITKALEKVRRTIDTKMVDAYFNFYDQKL